MEVDTTWTVHPQQFYFAACSGALLVNIFAAAQGANGKMKYPKALSPS
jgi:hypothetical protein